MSMTAGRAFEVRQDSLQGATRVVVDAAREPGAGEVLMAVERFGLSSNNLTYAMLGNAFGLNYWKPFPAEEGWGRVPAWGVARVLAGDPAVAQPGERYVGFVPMSDQMLLRAGATPDGLEDASPERADMLPLYRSMRRIASDPTWREDLLAINLLLRPAYPAAALLDDELGSAGTPSVVLTSATSKTALMTGRLLTLRGVQTIGLTSDHHRAAAEATGAYERVLSYDEVTQLPGRSTVLLDIAGNSSTTRAIHAQLGDHLDRSLAIGGTHTQSTPEDPASAPPLTPPQELYNTGAQEAELARTLSQREVQALEDRARDILVPWAAEWMSVETRSGLEALEKIWEQLRRGTLHSSPLSGITVVPVP